MLPPLWIRSQQQHRMHAKSALADDVPALLWSCDLDAQCTDLNLGWLRFRGRERAQEHAHGWLEGIHPDDRERRQQTLLEAARSGRPCEQEFRLKRHDGAWRWMLEHVSPHYSPGGVLLGLAGVCLDITHRRNRDAEERLKDDFLCTVSHELRTPLSAILGWAGLLKRGRSDSSTLERAVEAIERSARLEAQLVEDLLEVARLVSGRTRLELRQVELTESIREAVRTLEATARERSIQVHVRSDTNSLTLPGDPRRLQQVVSHLIANALKFTPAGGHVEVSLQRCGAEAHLRVTDNGKGIPPEKLPHIFESFRQGDGSLTRSHGGLGLGLAIARKIVQMHGGVIDAVSQGEGQGATFLVRIPLPSPSKSPAPTSIPTALEHTRILLLAEASAAREFLQDTLQKAGAQVLLAANLSEALSAVASTPHLLLTELSPNNTHGFDLLSHVRSLSPREGGLIPAAALAKELSPEVLRRALAAGFQTVLPREISSVPLLAALRDLTGRGPWSPPIPEPNASPCGAVADPTPVRVPVPSRA